AGHVRWSLRYPQGCEALLSLHRFRSRGGLCNRKLASALIRNQHDEQRENTAADRQNAPHDPLPRRWYFVGVYRRGWWHSLFAPDRNRAIVEVVNFSPAGEHQQRFVVRIVQKNPLQAVVIGMAKDSR